MNEWTKKIDEVMLLWATKSRKVLHWFCAFQIENVKEVVK